MRLRPVYTFRFCVCHRQNYCANGGRPFDTQNGFQTQVVCQAVRHLSHNGKL